MTSTPIGPEPLMDIREAARRIGCSEKTIRRGIATTGRHHLRATKVRGRWRIAPADLDAWVRTYAVKAAS